MRDAPLISPSDLARTGTGDLVVGLSGGLDSSVLLHVLASLAPARERGLRAVHIHHGLHADADRWAEHCERLCQMLDVPLRRIDVTVDLTGGHGPEAAARHARYAAFAAELDDGDVLVLAHHRDDQAETFLLRALRASGPDGLAAMRPWRPFARGWLWRPLLSRGRAELLSHARAHGLTWIEDPSNVDVSFDRNFLRHQVMPLLRERWPHADSAFARAAELCAQAGSLLATEDAQALAQVSSVDPHVLSRTGLRSLPGARRARVLRLWIDRLGLPALTAEALRRIESELLDSTGPEESHVAWSNAVATGWRDLLHAGPQRVPLPPEWRCHWDGSAPLPLPDGAELRLAGSDRLAAVLIVSARHGGERIVLPGRRHSHALKHVLQDLGVPPWMRPGLPLLLDADGAVLAAGDLVYSAPFDDWLRTAEARLVWKPAG